VGDGEAGVVTGGEGSEELGDGLMFGLILGLGLPGGSDTGKEAGEEGVYSMMGDGARDMDFVTRARDMSSTSVARVIVIVVRGSGSEDEHDRAMEVLL